MERAGAREAEPVFLVGRLADETGIRRRACEALEGDGIAIGKDIVAAAAPLLARILGEHGCRLGAEGDVDVAGRDAVAADLRTAIDRLVGVGAAGGRIDA